MKNLSLILVIMLSTAAGAKDTSGAKEKSGATQKTNRNVVHRKTQSVDFENTDIDGKVNSPDGAYLLQKRGVQFIPLYKVNNQFEKSILESVEYLR